MNIPKRYVLCIFLTYSENYVFNINHMVVYGGKAVASTYLKSPEAFPKVIILIEPDENATSLSAIALYGAAHGTFDYSAESNHVILVLHRTPVTTLLTVVSNTTDACMAGFYNMTLQFSADVSGLTDNAFVCSDCTIGNITRRSLRE